MKSFQVASVVLGYAIFYSTQVVGNPYRHVEVLDSNDLGKYMLEWEVNWEARRVLFNATVETKGNIGFGFSSKGQLAGADIVIGGVTQDGESYFTDQHGVKNGLDPPLIAIDPSQDWDLHAAWENDSHTFLSFSRAFDTCDDENDHVINEHDMIMLLWAYGNTDNTSHDELLWGKFQAYLLDPDHTPTPIKMSTFKAGPPSGYQDLGYKVWTVTKKIKIPPQDTLYHCTMTKGPRLGTKHHIIGFQNRLETEQARMHTHHIVFYRCIAPPGTDPVQLFSPFLNSSGDDCYFLSRPRGKIPTQYCTTVVMPWAAGGRMMFLPAHLGFSFGESLDEYYLLQVHHDNQNRLSTIEDEYYFSKAFSDVSDVPRFVSICREADAGILTIGHHVPGASSILLPPNTSDHQIFGNCGPDCTTKMLPAEGIKFVTVIPHTHFSGRKIRMHHYRGNQELRYIVSDLNWDYLFHSYRMLHKEVTVQQGDHISISCTYDTNWVNASVLGGFSTKHEMCTSYIFYYNKLEDYSLCRSEIVSEAYVQQYLGVKNITWNDSLLDYVATSPANVTGLTLNQISDEYVEWTPELREKLKQDHRQLPQVNACSKSPFSSIGQGQVEGTGAESISLVKYPSDIIPFVPDDARSCKK